MNTGRLNVSAGQTLLSPRCRAALSQQMDAPIYYPDYYSAEMKCAGLLQDLIGTRSEVLLITGNATHAMETVLLSLIEKGESILTVNGGTFGQVFTQLAERIGIIPKEVQVPHGRAITAPILGHVLDSHPNVKAITLVHVETSTGVIAPLAELSRVAHDHDKLLIVDAVSSVGAAPVQMDEIGVDVLISSGQKALNAPQGLSILAINKRAWQVYHDRKTPVPSVCLDLGIWQEYRALGVVNMMAAWRGEPILSDVTPKIVHGPSPSGPLVYGLLGALEDLFQEGLDKVYQRHQAASRAVREGLRALNLLVLAAEEVAAPSATAAMLPTNISELELRKAVYTQHGIALGAGPLEIGLNSIRIGTMGRTAHPDAVLPALQALGKTLTTFEHPCQPEAGVRAAKDILYTEQIPHDLWKIPNDTFVD